MKYLSFAKKSSCSDAKDFPLIKLSMEPCISVEISVQDSFLRQDNDHVGTFQQIFRRLSLCFLLLKFFIIIYICSSLRRIWCHFRDNKQQKSTIQTGVCRHFWSSLKLV